jgi:tripartite-type tricarboxylate transporter receptor subunit TctC
MNKILSFVTSLMISSSAFAAEQVEIVNRYATGTGPFLVALDFTNILNQIQSLYEFRLTTIAGAGGESADQRALAIARTGKNVLLFTAKSSWTTNRYAFGMTYDRDNDIVPLYGVSSIKQGLAVASNRNIKSIDELVSYLKNKKEAFVGYPQGSVGGQIYDNLFREKYNINNVKSIYYSGKDMNLALQNGEMDYTFWSLGDLKDIDTLAVINNVRYKDLPNVPTIYELNFTNKDSTSLSLFAVQKERKEFGLEMLDMIKSICNTEPVQSRIVSLNIAPNCMEQKTLINAIESEKIFIEQYKDLVNFK